MKALILALLLMNCIPNPLTVEPDKQAKFAVKAMKGTLHAKNLVQNPGAWYWEVSASGVISVSLDGNRLEEFYGYVIEGSNVLIFEVIGVDSVKYEIITRGSR